MHPLVSTQIGELRVRLEADLANERLDAAVNVSVLLQPAGGGERLAALGAGVAAGPDVLSTNVPLQVAGVGEHLVAVLAGEL